MDGRPFGTRPHSHTEPVTISRLPKLRHLNQHSYPSKASTGHARRRRRRRRRDGAAPRKCTPVALIDDVGAVDPQRRRELVQHRPWYALHSPRRLWWRWCPRRRSRWRCGGGPCRRRWRRGPRCVIAAASSVALTALVGKTRVQQLAFVVVVAPAALVGEGIEDVRPNDVTY